MRNTFGEFIEKNKLQLGVITLACFAVYANAFTGDFVSDDISAILRNPDISKFMLPSSTVSFATSLNTIIYWIFKLNSTAYHIPSILFHLLNSILVYSLLNRKLNKTSSLVGTLVFTTHPVTTETISWIAGRHYAMSASFILSSLLLYLESTKEKRIQKVYYVLSLVLFSSALYTSGLFLLMFPIFLVVKEALQKNLKKKIVYTIPFFIISGQYFLTKLNEVPARVESLGYGTGSDPRPLELLDYIARSSQIILEDLKLVLWPARLTIYHDSFVVAKYSWLILVPLIGTAVYTFRKNKTVFLALTWFFLFLAPTLSPIQVTWMVAERYLYLPLVAFAFLVGYGYQKLLPKIRGADWEGVVHVLLLLLLVGYGVRTIVRNKDWDHRDKLWLATVKTNPLSRQAHLNMGDVYSNQGRWVDSVREFQTSIKLAPEHPHGYHNLANVYHTTGEYELAITNFQIALEKDPNLYQSHEQLGIIYIELKEFTKAKEEFQKALLINPNSQIAQLGLQEVTKQQP